MGDSALERANKQPSLAHAAWTVQKIRKLSTFSCGEM